MKKTYAKVLCSELAETDAALLIAVGVCQHWIPLSQIWHTSFNVVEGTTVWVSSWLADKEGIPYLETQSF